MSNKSEKSCSSLGTSENKTSESGTSNQTTSSRQRSQESEFTESLKSRLSDLSSGTTSSSDCPSSVSLKWRICPLPKKKQVPIEESKPAGYLGVVTRKAAERRMGALRTAVYHQLPFDPLLDNMKTKVLLAMVFRESKNTFLHLPIREHTGKNGSPEYFVDAGHSRIPKTFDSIENLMKFHVK